VSGYSDLVITPAGALGVHFVYSKGSAWMALDPTSILRSQKTDDETEDVVSAVNRTLLMVDDHDILYRAGLMRRLEPLRRPTPGVPVLRPTEEWESLLAYTSVQRVGDDKLMMFYQSYAAQAGHSVNGSGCFVCLATSSDDGITWVKPELGVLKSKSGLDTNVVWAPSPKMYFGSVLYEANAVADKRFKMTYWDFQKHPVKGFLVPGLYTAFSADGVKWVNGQPWAEPKIMGGGGGGSAPPFADQNASSIPAPAGNFDTELSVHLTICSNP
jgi:hypothetical protein